MNVKELKKGYLSESVGKYITVRFSEKHTDFIVINCIQSSKPNFDDYDYGITEIKCEVYKYDKWRLLYADKVKIVPITKKYFRKEILNDH